MEKNLEAFWAGKRSKAAFLQEQKSLRLSYLQKQQQLGLDLIPVGDFSNYDHVLDTAVAFGIVPERFTYDGGKVEEETYFAIAREAMMLSQPK